MIGVMVTEFFTPALPGILVDAGLDFAVFDMESTSLTYERLEMLALLSRAVGLSPLVRTATNEAGEIGRVLALGAEGVMAPKIASVEEARRFVAATRFPPEGLRGSGYSAYPSGYIAATTASDRDHVNGETIAICQLESRVAVEQAEAIAGLPGVDALNVGANDLAGDLGVDVRDRRILESVERVREACIAAGKSLLGRAPGDGPVPHGHRLVLVDHDTSALAAHIRSSVAALREKVSG